MGGWSTGWESREELVEDLLDWPHHDVLASESTSCGLWVVFAGQKDEAPWIMLFLLDETNGDWGYKDLPEVTHPYYYDCPPSMLEMAPVACAEWRENVRAMGDA